MRIIRFVAFLFYRYYTGGKKSESIPVFRTLASMTLLVFIHLMQILIVLNRVDLIPTKPTDNIWSKRLAIFAVMLPIFLVLSLLIKKRDLEELKQRYQYDRDKVFNANIWLVVYIILSFSMIFILKLVIK